MNIFYQQLTFGDIGGYVYKFEMEHKSFYLVWLGPDEFRFFLYDDFDFLAQAPNWVESTEWTEVSSLHLLVITGFSTEHCRAVYLDRAQKAKKGLENGSVV